MGTKLECEEVEKAWTGCDNMKSTRCRSARLAMKRELMYDSGLDKQLVVQSAALWSQQIHHGGMHIGEIDLQVLCLLFLLVRGKCVQG